MSTFRENHLQSQLGGHIEKRQAFGIEKNNESEKQLQVAPVMEQEDQGGGLERTKAEYYAAVIKSGLACLL